MYSGEALRVYMPFILPVSIILRTSAGPHLDFNSQIDADRTSILWRPPVCLQVDGRHCLQRAVKMEMTDYYDKNRDVNSITRVHTNDDEHVRLRNSGVEKSDANYQDDLKEAVEEKVIDGNEAFSQAVILEPPRTWSRVSIVLYMCCLLGFLCSTMNGYDGSLFNALTINHQFLEHFNGSNTGPWQAMVSSMYQIGGVVALPFVGPALDSYGRRVGMFIGAAFVVVGTIIQGLTEKNASIGQFMAGRLLLGFGVTITGSAGPMYVVEVSHPAHRGVVTALYNTFW